MSCKEMRELIHAWLDREVDPARSLEIEEHIRNCPACLRESRSFEVLRAAVAGQATYHTAPAALERQVRSALRGAARDEMPTTPRIREWLAEFSWSRFFAPVAASAVVVLFLVFLLSRPSQEELWAQAVVSAPGKAMARLRRARAPGRCTLQLRSGLKP